MKITPEQVADYARNDSLALKEVDLKDLIEEIRIRGTESNTLFRCKVITIVKKLATTLDESLRRSTHDDVN